MAGKVLQLKVEIRQGYASCASINGPTCDLVSKDGTIATAGRLAGDIFFAESAKFLCRYKGRYTTAGDAPKERFGVVLSLGDGSSFGGNRTAECELYLGDVLKFSPDEIAHLQTDAKDLHELLTARLTQAFETAGLTPKPEVSDETEAA